MFEKLQNELLPEVERIAYGPGESLGYAHFCHGVVLRILKRFNEAEAAFLKSNELNPGCVNTLREIVLCMGKLGLNEKSLPYAREATEVGPVDTGAWGNLAMCLLESGEHEEARKAIDYAIDLDPQDPINPFIRDNFDRYCNQFNRK